MLTMEAPSDKRPKMAFHDLVIYSRDKQPVVAMMIRAGKLSTPDQLEFFREVLMDPSEANEARYYLLLLRHDLFLWRETSRPGENPEQTSLTSVLRAYAPIIAGPDDFLTAECLLIAMHFWLDDLAVGIRKPKPDCEADQFIVRTGIYDEIRDGRVDSRM